MQVYNMRRLRLTPYLRLDELEARYRQAADPVARSHWHILWLLAQGQSILEVVRNTGYSATWIYTIARRYNHDGPAGVGDRRHTNPGSMTLLSPEQQAELAAALKQPPSSGGSWTSRKVAEWMAARLGRKVHVARGWEMLRRLGYAYPRKRRKRRFGEQA
jgi:transposase